MKLQKSKLLMSIAVMAFCVISLALVACGIPVFIPSDNGYTARVVYDFMGGSNGFGDTYIVVYQKPNERVSKLEEIYSGNEKNELPEKFGYFISDYYLDVDKSDEDNPVYIDEIDFASLYTKDNETINIYVEWEHELWYQRAYIDENSGETVNEVNPTVVNAGDKYKKPSTTPKRKGYTFDGYYDDPDYTIEYDFDYTHLSIDEAEQAGLQGVYVYTKYVYTKWIKDE